MKKYVRPEMFVFDIQAEERIAVCATSYLWDGETPNQAIIDKIMGQIGPMGFTCGFTVMVASES